MRNMTRGDVVPGGLTVQCLIVEEDVGPKGLQKRSLRPPPKEEAFVQADVPGPERANDPFMRRGRSARSQRCANWTGIGENSC